MDRPKINYCNPTVKIDGTIEHFDGGFAVHSKMTLQEAMLEAGFVDEVGQLDSDCKNIALQWVESKSKLLFNWQPERSEELFVHRTSSINLGDVMKNALRDFTPQRTLNFDEGEE